MIISKYSIDHRFIMESTFSLSTYIVGIFLTAIIFYFTQSPFVFWIQTGFVVAIIIARGVKSIYGILMGVLIWLGFAYLYPFALINSNFKLFTVIVLLDLVSAFAAYKLLQNQLEKNALIEKLFGIKKFIITIILVPLPQVILSLIVLFYWNTNNEITILNQLQIIWLSILLSIATITPLFISFSSAKTNSGFTKMQFSWEFIIYLIALVITLLVDVLHISSTNLSFPLKYIAIPAILVISFRNNIKTLAVSLFLFGIISFYFINVFQFEGSTLFTINALYFANFIALVALIINTVCADRKQLIESNSLKVVDIETEVLRQTKDYSDLTSKLFEEIAQKGLMERELIHGRKLLAESQDIAKIASWEIFIEEDEIHWSESAYKVIGFSQDKIPSRLSDYIETIHPDDTTVFKNLLKDVTNSSASLEVEIRHIMPNGQTNFFLVRCRSFEEEGGAKRVVGLSFDITDRKLAEVQIFEKEQKYRALFESNIDSICLINPLDKTFVDVNHAFELKYGYTKEEIIGLPYSTITAEKEDSYLAIENANRKGSHRVLSRIHKKKNGEVFYIEGLFVKYTSLDKPMLFVINHDVTQRKVAEKNLVERELQYRLFFESDLIGMAETSTQKNWINFNNKLCTILGYTPEELKQKTWEQLTHPDDLIQELKFFNEVLVHKNDGYKIEKRFIKKDGSFVNCNVSVKAIINSNGNITHLVKLIEDISARKQTEKELIESRSTLRRAQQIAHLGTLSWNLSVNYLSINDEGYSILGWKKSEGPYNISSFINLVVPEKRKDIEKIVNDTSKGIAQTENIEVPFLYRLKEVRYLLLNVGFNIKNSIEVSELVFAIADITDVKKAEIALQEANMLKDQLFSVIAHDLKGPIGSINQMITLLAGNLESYEISLQNDILKSLKSTTQETFNLLENLLDWAKSQRQTSINPKIILVKPIIDDSIALLSSMSNAKGISIITELEDGLSVFADPYMVNTIFRNLISNAIKFSSNGNTIIIKGLKTNTFIALEFIDSGVGISPEVLGKLFNTDENYSTLGTNNEKGTGLGLKLIKRFVEKNKGTLAIDSQINKGSIFTITLPSQKQ